MNNKGITLIEIMIIFVIFLILVSVLVCSITGKGCDSNPILRIEISVPDDKVEIEKKEFDEWGY